MKRIFALILAAVMLCAAVAVAEETAGATEELPAYSYTGEDPIEGAIANKAAEDEYREMYLTEPGCVNIPCVTVFKTEKTDETHAKAYGKFWTLNYVKEGKTLVCISGGEHAGIVTLEKNGESWQVTDIEEAGEGTVFAEDIERFANGDEELKKLYTEHQDMQEEPLKGIRNRFIRDYVEANGLDTEAYQDRYWDPIPLV